MLTTQIPALMKVAKKIAIEGGSVQEVAEVIGSDVLALQRLYQACGTIFADGRFGKGVEVGDVLFPVCLWAGLTALKYRPRARTPVWNRPGG